LAVGAWPIIDRSRKKTFKDKYATIYERDWFSDDAVRLAP